MAAMSFDLPPGFRFRPTELEIIEYYLRLKITGNDEKAIAFIREVDFLKWEPWQLPGLSGIEAKDQEWFYFSQPEKKQPNGKQFNRTTNSGFWKVSGHDKEIFSGGRSIGKKKILVFHQGSAANGKRTDWVMHEHRTTLKELDGTKPGQKPYVFCRLFYKPKQNSGKAEDHPITSNECLHPENFDGMECDTTIATGTAKSASESPNKGCKGRKRKYTSKAEPAKSKRSAAAASPSLELLPIDHTPTEEFLLSKISDTIPSAENQVAESMKHVIADEVDLQPEIPLTSLSDAAAVSFPTTAKSSPEEAESDPRQALESGEEEKAQVTDMEFDQQLQEELKWLPFLLQNPIDWNVNSPAVPSPNTAKPSPEEAESDPRQASASPASGEKADNRVTSFSPTKNLDESTSNTKAFTGCNRINDNTQTTKSTAGDQVGDSNMPCAPPEQPVPDIDWNSLLLCPVDSQMQKVLGPFCMSSFDANEPNYLYDGVAWQNGSIDSDAYQPNYLYDGVAWQNGTIDSDAYCSELWDLMPDESLRNDPSSQKTLAFDPRPWFMESDKDDGSHSAPNAKKLNALFDSTVQDSMRSVEINTEAVSSGSYIDGGTSSIRSS